MTLTLDLSHATPEQIANVINYLKGNPSPVVSQEPKETYVALVLDESGSMESCRAATIEGFNSTIRDLKKAPASAGKFFVTLVLVNGRAYTRYVNVPLDKVTELTYETYRPGGSTPLYDGIGSAIGQLSTIANQEISGINRAYLVSIFTDGWENASKEWTGPTLSSRITQLQKTDLWTFTVTGANISLTDLSQAINIPVANMQAYAATPAGTSNAWNIHQHSNASYSQLRAMGGTSSAEFYEHDHVQNQAQNQAPNPPLDLSSQWIKNTDPALSVQLSEVQRRAQEQAQLQADLQAKVAQKQQIPT